MDNKVDYVITDSPLSLSAYYAHYSSKQGNETTGSLCSVIIHESNKMNNLNFFVNRTHEYEVEGRSQSEEESLKLKQDLRDFLNDNDVKFLDVYSGDDLPNWMMHGLFTTKELFYNGEMK